MEEPRIEMARWWPAPALRSYVAWFVGYREAGALPARHRGLPSPFLTLILTLDDPLVMAQHPDPAQAPGRYETLIGGLHTRPALITHDGRQSGIQLALHPLGARALLGCPAGELASLDVRADDVLGAAVAEWRERILAAATWTDRFVVLERSLLGRLADAGWPAEPAPALTEAWSVLAAHRGGIPVATVARQVGWSERQLRKRLVAETGLTPKAAARVMRFDHARRTLLARVGHGGPADLASLAADCGYYDQSHLTREFRGLAGCSPSRWLAEEHPNLGTVPELVATARA
jgi:AraC-like DNA-binding protein